MAETANIAKMAEILSKDLFSEFLWERVGPINWNWSCEESEVHKIKTHPSDVVFYYDEPYTAVRTYVNCDLKSYGKATINLNSVKTALDDLALTLTCAEKSDEWRAKYIHPHISPEICGLLFVYNHDGEYNKDFNKLLNQIKHVALNIPKKSKIVVLGPEDIHWLNNVRYQIIHMRGSKSLPERNDFRYFYPHLARKKNVQWDKAKAATLEMLTAPWIILSYSFPNSPSRKGVVIFYRREGKSVEEFLYLIDYLLHYQVLVEDTDIHIKIYQPHENAHSCFEKAIHQYIEQCQGGQTIEARLKSIKFEKLEAIHHQFSLLQIGMKHD